jgi:hypothetical protein
LTGKEQLVTLQASGFKFYYWGLNACWTAR